MDGSKSASYVVTYNDRYESFHKTEIGAIERMRRINDLMGSGRAQVYGWNAKRQWATERVA